VGGLPCLQAANVYAQAQPYVNSARRWPVRQQLGHASEQPGPMDRRSDWDEL